MIAPRLHGALDYLVAAGLALLAREGRFSPDVTQVLRTAAPATAAYSALTDYELGLVPVLSLRQHLATDVLSGLGFIAAGALMSRSSRPPTAGAATWATDWVAWSLELPSTMRSSPTSPGT